MRIPTNSTFTKEISKQFKRIFHKDMSLGSLEEIKNCLRYSLQQYIDNHTHTNNFHQISPHFFYSLTQVKTKKKKKRFIDIQIITSKKSKLLEHYQANQ